MKTFSTAPRREARRQVPCASCGGSAFVPLWDYGSYAFVRCAGCGLVQQNPQPEQEAVAARYDGTYLSYEEQNQFAYRDLELLALADLGVVEPAAGGASAGRARREASSGASRAGTREGPSRAPRGRALDVGCATGALLDALRDRGWEPQGVEICAPAAEYGRARFGLPIHAGDLASAAFPGGCFDLVHASHLIEHLADPRAFLAEARRLVAPGGTLVLTTPNVDGFQARILGSAWRSAIFDHLYLFSLSTLSRMLAQAGFIVERSVTWGGWAKGLRPAVAKPVLDRMAKALGFGDVCAVLARPSAP